jgi:hypothetical protein
LLTSSDITIEIKPSKDFLKLGFLLHLLACVILWNSSLSGIWVGCGCSLMVISFLHFLINALNSQQLLLRRSGRWIVQSASTDEALYEHLTIEFDGGFYVYLKLSNLSGASKKMLVFRDQWTREEERLLRIVSTIIQNKT